MSDRTFLLPKQWGFQSPYLQRSVYHIWHCWFCLESFSLWLSRGRCLELYKLYRSSTSNNSCSKFTWSCFPKLFLIYFYGFSYCLVTGDSQPYLQSQPAPWSSYLYIQLPAQNTTWMSCRHLKCNMLKTELIIFSLSWYLFCSLSHLLSQLANQSCKLGILFDSSHSFIPQIKPTD